MILSFQSSIPLKQLLSTIWNLWFVKEMGENPYIQILWKLENKNSVNSGNFVICIYNFWNSPWRIHVREIFGRDGIIIQFRLSPQSINQSITDCPILGFLFFSVRVQKFHNTIRGWQVFTKALPRGYFCFWGYKRISQHKYFHSQNMKKQVQQRQSKTPSSIILFTETINTMNQ